MTFFIFSEIFPGNWRTKTGKFPINLIRSAIIVRIMEPKPRYLDRRAFLKIAGTLAADVLLGGGCISRLDTPLATSEAAAPLTEEERQQRDEEYRLRELENWRRELSAANLSLAEEADFYAYRADGLYYINDEATDRETARTAYQFVADNLASVGHETPIGALLNKNVKVVDDRLW